MNDVTLAMVSCNGLHGVSLAWESYCKYHDRAPLLVYDNASTDGTREYLQAHADYVYCSDTNDGHGIGLDHLCSRVTTPYVLTIDTDIEFHKPTVDYLKSCNSFAVHQCHVQPSGYFWRYGKAIWQDCLKQWGFQVWCCLFRTEELVVLLDAGLSFSLYTNSQKKLFHDTGSIMFNAACAAGMSVTETDLMGQGYVSHYDGMTVALILDPQQGPTTKWKHDLIKNRLEILRQVPGREKLPFSL